MKVLGSELTKEEVAGGIDLLVEAYQHVTRGQNEFSLWSRWATKVEKWNSGVNVRRRREVISEATESINPVEGYQKIIEFLEREGFFA